MAKFFGRQYMLTFSDENDNVLRVIDSREEATPLQVEFGIEVSFGAALSLMEISIYNLNKESIGQIVTAKKIELQAGYPDAFGLIFKGRISNPIAPREGNERRLTLWCWSGLKEQKEKVCVASFAAGTKYESIVDFIARDVFGRPAEYIGFDNLYRSKMGIAEGGYSEKAPHKTLLKRLGDNLGFQWLIENERCILMARGAQRTGVEHRISAETGLVGSVGLTFMGADFDTLLNPKIQIGDVVVVDAQASSVNFSGIYSVSLPKEKTVIGDGRFVVKAMRRRGNFYGKGADWTNSLTCWREDETGLEKEGLRDAG